MLALCSIGYVISLLKSVLCYERDKFNKQILFSSGARLGQPSKPLHQEASWSHVPSHSLFHHTVATHLSRRGGSPEPPSTEGPPTGTTVESVALTLKMPVLMPL